MNHHKLPKPDREHPSTYFVQNRSNREELARLQVQDQLVTAAMGGVLPEQTNPERFQRILDVGCGTGDWLIQAAQALPGVRQLVGVDVSAAMVACARLRAEAHGVADRVEFHIMDALRALEFTDGYFSLVNHRFGVSWLRTWDWPKLLDEYKRVANVGGVIRITEGGALIACNSPALTRLCHLTLDAFFQAGHYFIRAGDGITGQLERLLEVRDIQDVRIRELTVEYCAGTTACQRLCEDLTLVFRNILPFLRQWTRVPGDYDDTYRQALADMAQPDFTATTQLTTAWGTNQGYSAAGVLLNR